MVKKGLIGISLALNILTIPVLFYLTFYYNLVGKILYRVLPSNRGDNLWVSYEDNSQYRQQVELYNIYNKSKADIVMLGDSITCRVNWNELLNRDVANRGIESDVTDGFVNRLKYIYRLNPKICFIMGGVNDIARNIPVQRIFQNYKSIIEGLKSHAIIPVIQSTLYISPPNLGYWNAGNSQIKKLNDLLFNYSNKENIKFIDLNVRFSRNRKLIQEYTYDGVHLNSKGYKMWAEEIERVLKGYGF